MATQPNLIEVTDWLAMEALRLLTNALEVAPTFNSDYDDQLDMEFPVGKTFRVPLPDNFLIRNGLQYNPQSIVDRHTDISCDQVHGVDFEWDSVEAALTMPRTEERIRKKVLVPAMKKQRQEIDSRAANFAMLNTPNVVGILGTSPDDFDAIYGAADERLTVLAGNSEDKTMLLSPGMARSLRKSAVSYFNPTDEIAAMFKKGYIGEVTGFGQSYQSMSLYQTTSDLWQGTVEVNTSMVADGNTLLLTTTAGDTFTAGTPFVIADVYDTNPMTLRSTGNLKNLVIETTVVAAGGTTTVTFYPAIVGPGSPYQNVTAYPLAGADLTQYPGTVGANAGTKIGVNGLAITKDAFALVGVKLQNPKASSAEIVSQAQDPETGISVAFLRMFDPVSRKWINRFDSCYGFGRLWADHCAVRVFGLN